ncbi:MAG TPA: hypothetical protein VGN37_07995 [Actinocatenispora sp.]
MDSMPAPVGDRTEPAPQLADGGDAGRSWRPMSRSTIRSGYVVVVGPARRTPGTQDHLYWCGHAGWDSFVNWLFYRDPRTDAEVAAPVSVYPTRVDALVAWEGFLADRRTRRIPPPSDAIQVVSLGQIAEVSATPNGGPPNSTRHTEGPYDV